MVGVGRVGVVVLATAAVALASALPALAQDGPAAPATEATPAETTAEEGSTPPPAPAAPTESTSAPADTAPSAPKDPPAESQTPSDGGGTTEATAPASETAPTTETAPKTETAPAEAEPTTAPKDAVKLEQAAPTTPVAPTTPAPTVPAAQPTQQQSSSTPPVTIQAAPEATQQTSINVPVTDADEDAAAQDAIVSFRPRPATSAISLLPADEPVLRTVRTIRPVKTVVVMRRLVQSTCSRSTPRVPLSVLCRQTRAVAVLRVTLPYSPSPEVRAVLVRAGADVTVRRVDEGRAPPKSKAAKKHPVATARPTIPFGSSGQGVANDGYSGSPGSASSSRLFALPAAPLKVPLPFRFARLRLPSTVPQGASAAPPTARPG